MRSRGAALGSPPITAGLWLQQGPSSSDAALPTRVGVTGDAREAGLPSLQTAGKYILIWTYIEKTAHIPKFLEKRG